MALKLIANYSKRLGLPGYSSHQFSVCVEIEIGSVADVAGESSRLYQTLQQSVDEEIKHVGYVPTTAGGNGHSNGHKSNGNGSTHGQNGSSFLGKWHCSQKQQDLILKLIEDNQLPKQGIEDHANGKFGKGVKHLDTKEASSLIEWMFMLTTTQTSRGRRPTGTCRT